MTLETLVVWIIIGAIAGLLAFYFVRGTHIGMLGMIVVGMLGGLIGGWLFGQLGISVGTGLVSEIFTAFVGAVILLLILRATRRL
ncbi:MAG: GlsB/YeaQ/YmgE family stress response membrane protein [Anaerolineae bacterium]